MDTERVEWTKKAERATRKAQAWHKKEKSAKRWLGEVLRKAMQ